MKTSDFDYHLPHELIAQEPLEPRDSSRLMVINRAEKTIKHTIFNQLPDMLGSGDVLVFNNSRVLPARIHGKRALTGGNIEILLLKKLGVNTWEVMAKPARKLKTGEEVDIPQVGVSAKVIQEKEEGIRVMSFSSEEDLFKAGEMPLPPYIHRPLENGERYQTVYSRALGSAAAPTSGLHFTPGLLDLIKEKGIETHFVTLHIGLDTFRPINADDPREHAIHTEYGQIDPVTAGRINTAKKEGRRVIAVGTSTARLLEQAAGEGEYNGWVSLYILPGYQYRVVDGLITNFHLPRSSLLMLVSAFAGKEFIFECYQEAIKEAYRFYSFGDAMLIV
ncbi:MAG: tRNA preQ1(34) S-adenosylmethionine ribosyltransferase-isomerase QueA [Dehalococcoidales bacterium]|jgi:S-adenosylmethionine:tRNA ribosyltransferase-isomerase|nr:tRNA preQ1(34) S-adenosylmethionine ribosyltransferase-isomerase QueA [Dehalococcoidales bacterium]MDD3264970.1 tRNA preQ1(34) S-adenosylmethionine ribosyltransferase-isomerase QueA [Dehalococcoidales bacterium]MDD4322045.1 tRNA preQ1(34) S-adenosylmethionine ribosyltransferase-isomerase QueA [Dehalococcoidales bacterium]MDD4794645.1 tRNA preQ1(34) S-adenosylmethionine ribosyltransferase-isomerase QueA [Dehalococcoidales bacterium]MDD5122506.1 tRNA preQ1(34) S-adenosylmethionine ribosyltrans